MWNGIIPFCCSKKFNSGVVARVLSNIASNRKRDIGAFAITYMVSQANFVKVLWSSGLSFSKHRLKIIIWHWRLPDEIDRASDWWVPEYSQDSYDESTWRLIDSSSDSDFDDFPIFSRGTLSYIQMHPMRATGVRLLFQIRSNGPYAVFQPWWKVFRVFQSWWAKNEIFARPNST